VTVRRFVQTSKCSLELVLNYLIFNYGPVQLATLYALNLLLSTTRDIRVITASTPNKNPKMKFTTIVKNYTYISTLDFHYEYRKICWADHEIESIQCCQLNGTVIENKVI